MATYKTLSDVEKARDGAALKTALKAANGKVVKVKRILLGVSEAVYVTGDIDKALIQELTEGGKKKQAIVEFSLGVSGNRAYISSTSAAAFMEFCRKVGVRLASVSEVSDVAAALRDASAG